jgi:hypothetical protein
MRVHLSWSRIILFTIAALTLALGISMGFAPGKASALAQACPAIYPRPAYCDAPAKEPALASVGYTGWTYLNLNYCAPGRVCTLAYKISTPAWRWTGSEWRQTTLNGGWVYFYPYAAPWRWAWTQNSGWVAISGGRFELRSY